MENQTGKKVVVIVPGTGGRIHEDVVVTPGTTAGELLNELGLEGFWLKKARADGFLGMDEEIYGSVQDGAKLEASSPAEVG